jgi:hypothetical protein
MTWYCTLVDRITHHDPRRESWALLQELSGLTGKDYQLKETAAGTGFILFQDGEPLVPHHFKKDMPVYLLGVIHGAKMMRE